MLVFCVNPVVRSLKNAALLLGAYKAYLAVCAKMDLDASQTRSTLSDLTS
jgi:hypothetical protein